MQTLETINGIKPDDRELLEAAGWVDPRQLAQASADEVFAELEKANGMLKLVAVVPKAETIAQWIAKAQELTGEVTSEPVDVSDTLGNHGEAEVGPTGPVDYEADPDVQEMLKQAPLAIPIPNRILAEKGIPPSAISIAPVLNRAESDLDVRVTTKQRQIGSAVSNNSPKGRHAGVVKVADSGRSVSDGSKRVLDTSRMRTMDQPEEEPEGDQKERRRQDS